MRNHSTDLVPILVENIGHAYPIYPILLNTGRPLDLGDFFCAPRLVTSAAKACSVFSAIRTALFKSLFMGTFTEEAETPRALTSSRPDTPAYLSCSDVHLKGRLEAAMSGRTVYS